MDIYIYIYIYAPGAVSGGVEECTLNTRLLIYRIYRCIYRYACCRQRRCRRVRTEYTSPNIIYRHISVCVSVTAVSGGCRSAHCTQASFLYIPIYWYTSVYISVYNGCRQRRCIWVHTAHKPPSSARYIYRYIYRYIHCTQASFLPYTDIYIYIYIYIPIYMKACIDFFSLSFSRLNPCRPRSRDSRVRYHTHTHTFRFVLCC
jgi:hypothetical protein